MAHIGCRVQGNQVVMPLLSFIIKSSRDKTQPSGLQGGRQKRGVYG